MHRHPPPHLSVRLLRRLSQAKNVTICYQGVAEDRLTAMFSRQLRWTQLAAAVGALDGATIDFVSEADGSVVAFVRHPQIAAQQRRLRVDPQGKIVLHNDVLRVKGTAPAGTGTWLFARQVAGARALGIDRIEAYGAGNKEDLRWNGYYTWPRLGYNAELFAYEKRALQRDPQFRGSRIKDLNDLIQKGGAEWWKEYGDGRPMVFTLDGRSRSIRVLLQYLWSKGILSWQ